MWRLSVVGTDRLTGSGPGSLSGYFRAKMAQEKSDQGFRNSIYDCARNAVLRVREQHH